MKDEEAVSALYAQLMEGWNKGDALSFAAPFDQDGDLVAFDGMHFRGQREIVAFHGPLFDKWLRGTRLVGQVESIRLLTEDVALLHARGGTILRGGRAPARERDSIQTLVAVRREGRWQLAAFQNTRVRPMSAGALSALLWLLTDWLWRIAAPARAFPASPQSRLSGRVQS